MSSATTRSTGVLLVAMDADSAMPDFLTFGTDFEELLEVVPDIRGRWA